MTHRFTISPPPLTRHVGTQHQAIAEWIHIMGIDDKDRNDIADAPLDYTIIEAIVSVCEQWEEAVRNIAFSAYAVEYEDFSRKSIANPDKSDPI